MLSTEHSCSVIILDVGQLFVLVSTKALWFTYVHQLTLVDWVLVLIFYRSFVELFLLYVV